MAAQGACPEAGRTDRTGRRKGAGLIARRDGGPQSAPLRAFCARLKRLQGASGLTQAAVARHADKSTSQIGAILNGTIKRPPDWRLVQVMVSTCLAHAERNGRTVPADLSREEDWKRRYFDLEQDVDLAARPTGCKTGTPGKPIGRWDPFDLGVHHPIFPTAARHPRPGSSDLPRLPLYVMRAHDRELRKLLDPDRLGPRMVVLTGGSCTGKTRAAYEAVCACLPTWRLVRPETSADLLRLLTGPQIDAPMVLWLNETRAYFDGQYGEEAAAALRRLLTGHARIAVMGSMWNIDWQALTARPASGLPGHPQARELLGQSVVRIHVPSSFTGLALADVKRAAVDDLRLAEAVTAAKTGEIAQLLAAGPWLVDFYEHESDAHAKAVLRAAIDARLLGHHAPLPAVLLEEAATGYLDERQRAVHATWFDDALSQATAKIKEAAAPLTPVRIRHGAGKPDGYVVAEYLRQHASADGRRTLPPAELWDALAAHTVGADDHARIAQTAEKRCYLRLAAVHYRTAAERGNPGALAHLARSRLRQRARLTEEEESWLWRAADRIDIQVMSSLALVLEVTRGIDEATAVWQPAAERGNSHAMRTLASWLLKAGLTGEAVWWMRRAAERGDTDAMCDLAHQLKTTGEIDQAERWLRGAAERGDTNATRQLAYLLSEAGRIDDAVTVWQPAAARGDIFAICEQGYWLERAGRTEEAATLRQTLSNRSDLPGGVELVAGLLEAAGWADGAKLLLRGAAERGDTSAMCALAQRLERSGGVDENNEAELLLRGAAERGNTGAMCTLARRLERDGQAEDAERFLRSAAERGDIRAMCDLADRLDRSGRLDDAECWLRRAAEPGDDLLLSRLARRQLTYFLERKGRIDEADSQLRSAAGCGDTDAMCDLAGLLERASRTDEAECWLRHAAEHGASQAQHELARLLRSAGRVNEADRLERYGLEPVGRTADAWAET
jgi:TPR repeat protein